MAEYVLLIQDDGGDYYVGRSAALYLDGQRIWFGYSNDEAENILRAVLGDELTVRCVKAEYELDLESCWWPTLTEQAARNDGSSCSAPLVSAPDPETSREISGESDG